VFVVCLIRGVPRLGLLVHSRRVANRGRLLFAERCCVVLGRVLVVLVVVARVLFAKCLSVRSVYPVPVDGYLSVSVVLIVVVR
jgi:hypothetical protein